MNNGTSIDLGKIDSVQAINYLWNFLNHANKASDAFSIDECVIIKRSVEIIKQDLEKLKNIEKAE
jgi:hypothetical protein